MYAADPKGSVDFYVGRGADAEYIGSEWGKGPLNLPGWSEFCALDAVNFTETDYRSVVQARRDAPVVEGFASDTWPHRHDNSDRTAWALCYDKGSVYVYHYGVEMQVWRCNTHTTQRMRGTTERVSRPVNDFPTMILVSRST